ncbi:hypothetical protein [Chryseobacterium sp. JAH]|uniref:hypothetical protein n=1 Tax=Chryseobacterium sp. JAH TaxID=1742858 RepID=UPI000740E4E4|nr:hypothetical protein [Chryseobacterium sp. JAH]KUJ53130.1 hypothetical protein AR685_01710 [Chryseobacterium sp. JAH]
MKTNKQITAKWQFISINDGKRRIVDDKMLNNFKKEYGTGTLEFKNDLSFSSLGSKNNNGGTYSLKDSTVIMQYSDLSESIKFNYSIVENKYLLLTNNEGKPHTWLYKKSN